MDVATSDRPSFEFPLPVLFREVDSEMVLLNVETEQYFGLDEVGAHIVTRLVNEPFDQALAVLEGEYEVEPAILHRDVHNLLQALLAAGLLTRVERAP